MRSGASEVRQAQGLPRRALRRSLGVVSATGVDGGTAFTTKRDDFQLVAKDDSRRPIADPGRAEGACGAQVMIASVLHAASKHQTRDAAYRAVLRRPKNTASEAEQRAEAPACDSASLRKPRRAQCHPQTAPAAVRTASARKRSTRKSTNTKNTRRRKNPRRTRNAAATTTTTPRWSPRTCPKEKLDAEDDYYARAAEFRVWLRDAKDLYLDDIAADEARKLFAQFAERWNAGRLDASYYSGEAAGRGGKRTRHAWSFKLSDTEARGLASARAPYLGSRRRTTRR